MVYDSKEDTLKHRDKVRILLGEFISELIERGAIHDQSKLEEPEKSAFDIYSPKLKETVYGSDEYRGYLKEMHLAVHHHYLSNRHHPEHFANGISGMNLIDLIEMLCDWMAAAKRMKDGGNIMESIRINGGRFQLGEQLTFILKNTVEQLKESN